MILEKPYIKDTREIHYKKADFFFCMAVHVVYYTGISNSVFHFIDFLLINVIYNILLSQRFLFFSKHLLIKYFDS